MKGALSEKQDGGTQKGLEGKQTGKGKREAAGILEGKDAT